MRLHLKKTIFSIIYLLPFISSLFILQSCEDSNKAEKSVDLRYRVEDSYRIEATNPEPISFDVKSSDSWEVFGEYNWHTITPNSGKADETFTVTITCDENTELDDRIDLINIKSDYWTGKQFTLTQRGTAYLNVEDDVLIDQLGGAEAFNILSNQKWTAKVTAGDKWLSIKSEPSGELDGMITVEASPNTGEMRTGTVTIYDRHGEIAREVSCTQDGVLLVPEVPENEEWFTIYEAAQQLVIQVESNTAWTVSKENEVDDDWYSFTKTDFDGTEIIIIDVSEHLGSSVRTAVIVLKTKGSDGAIPLVKTIKFKQANPKVPEVFNVNQAISGDYYGPGSLMPGRYNFYLEPFGETQINLFFIWSGSNPYAELRYHILDKKTRLSTTPWCSDVYAENGNTTHSVNTNQANVLSFEVQKVIDPKDPTKSWIYTEWILNNIIVGKATSDGISDANGTSDSWKVPFSEISTGGNFMLRASGGSVTFTKYEYIAPLVWGD